MRRPVIGIMGGGDANQEVCECARRIGRLVAEEDWVILCGGRNAGVMAAAAASAQQAKPKGFVVGVLPSADQHGASPDLDLAIVTGMGDARNVINILSCDVVMACCGAMGTLSEVALALKNSKPTVLVGFELRDSPFQPFIASGLLRFAATPEEAISSVRDLVRQRTAR